MRQVTPEQLHLAIATIQDGIRELEHFQQEPNPWWCTGCRAETSGWDHFRVPNGQNVLTCNVCGTDFIRKTVDSVAVNPVLEKKDD